MVKSAGTKELIRESEMTIKSSVAEHRTGRNTAACPMIIAPTMPIAVPIFEGTRTSDSRISARDDLDEQHLNERIERHTRTCLRNSYHKTARKNVISERDGREIQR